MGKWPGMVVHTCNPSTGEAKTGESWVEGQPELHIEFQASLSYITRLSQKGGRIWIDISPKKIYWCPPSKLKDDKHGTRHHYVMQNKADWERQISHVLSHIQNLVFKNEQLARHWWLTPVILAIQEADQEDHCLKPSQKKGWWSGSSGRAPT
jgi:hypothetical protein